ncbi:glycerol-3-phosphate dehydrogenase/oxidase [soil metagenome]
MQRPSASDLDDQFFDLIVIGGGINGAAIARDAALRGLSVALFEKSDFASGTTSWSTRLIHGGLRYLEHREFGLVRESLAERERLLRNAPHLVQPIQLHIPIYSHSKRGPWTIRAGLTLYDLLSLDSSLPRHSMLTSSEAIERMPDLDRNSLEAAAVYYDAQATFPERLVIENLIDAASNGAVIMNYARVERIVADGFVTTGAEITDLKSDTKFLVRSPAIVNVAGPWVDRLLDSPEDAPLVGGTKGTHIFLGSNAGDPVPPIYAESRSDGRAFFILPWNSLTMIGTTDTHYSGDLDSVLPTDANVEYLVAEADALLPGAGFSRDDILFAYSGVRPLPHSGNRSAAGITRRHFLVNHAPQRSGLYTIVGGKLTTHRSLAEHAVDVVCEELGHSTKSLTADRPLPGSKTVPNFDPIIPAAVHQHLRGRYGGLAADIMSESMSDVSALHPLVPGSPTCAAELLFAFRHEMATSLADALIRRTMTAYAPGLGATIAQAAAPVVGQHMGWSGEKITSEIEQYHREVARFRVVTTGNPL